MYNQPKPNHNLYENDAKDENLNEANDDAKQEDDKEPKENDDGNGDKNDAEKSNLWPLIILFFITLTQYHKHRSKWCW